MFGYVTINRVTLSKEGRQQYKSAYCGLCHALKSRYGKGARFILSFDTAFLLAVLGQKHAMQKEQMRCPYKCSVCECLKGDAADYAADATVILAYLNYQDDLYDTGSKRAKLMLRLLQNKFESAKKRRPELTDDIYDSLALLSNAERDGVCDPDIPADILGRLLGRVFAYDESLYQFGYTLGRFIYLCDAVCDFKSDIKHKRYNPLVRARRSDFENMLVFEMNRCLDEYEKLGIESELLENVLTDGIWLKYRLKGNR